MFKSLLFAGLASAAAIVAAAPAQAATCTATVFTAVASAVPDPAAWMMMILGLGAIGFAMRCQNVTTRVRFV